MNRIRLTVFFEDPFWIAIIERQSGDQFAVARHVFGSEPSNAEIHHFVLQQFDGLAFSRPLAADTVGPVRKMNPKRRRREAQRELKRPRTSTKAQEALQKEWEACAQERREISRQAREEWKQRRYELKQLKRKKKHSGR